MKRLLAIMCVVAGALSCSRYGAGIPSEYERALDDVLAGTLRADSLTHLVRTTPRSERKAMAHLLIYMPRGDRDTMRLDLLRENVHYASMARRQFAWTRDLPEEVFLDEVLPYAAIDEVRDSWRKEFYDMFSPLAAQCGNMREACDTINGAIAAMTGVEYNTAREKTNQSPSESMRQGMASCTGLAVMLVDALRAVGIPARFAGTASWHDNRGNHSWTEILEPEGWRYTEYYPPSSDQYIWFLPDAGKASEDDPAHAIYAVSFRPTGERFPMVWNEDSHDVHGVNVTRRYREAYARYVNDATANGTLTTLTIKMFRDALHDAESTDRVECNVDVFCDGEQIGGGRTAGALRDMNDALLLYVAKNRRYELRYENARGEATAVEISVGAEPATAVCYME